MNPIDRDTYPTYSWTNASSRVPHYKGCRCTGADNVLTVGGVNLSQISSEMVASPDDFDSFVIADFVLDLIACGRHDILYLHGVNSHILSDIHELLSKATASFGLQCYPKIEPNVDGYAPMRFIPHVSLHRTAVLKFEGRDDKPLRGNRFFESAKDEYRNNSGRGLVDEEPEDRVGLIETYKLRSKDRYVKFLSTFLRPLTCQPPPRHERGHLYRNISLKHGLYKFFCDSVFVAPADMASKCSYFVVGSTLVTEGTALLSSPVNEILTSGRLNVVAPHNEDYGSFDNPNSLMADVQELQFYDPEQAVPLPRTGMTCFMYNSKNAETHMLHKMDSRDDTEKPLQRGFEYIYVSGGRFFLLPNP